MLKYFVILSYFLLFSCTSSQNVSNGSFVQKRKYTKGYHFDFFAKSEITNNINLKQNQSSKFTDGLSNQIILTHQDSVYNEQIFKDSSNKFCDSIIESKKIESISEEIDVNTIQNNQNNPTKPKPDKEDKPKYDKTAKRAYLFGILSIFVLRIIFGILAMYYGIKAINKINSGEIEEFNRKKAVTGILLGFLMLILSFVYYFILLKLFDVI